MDFNGIRFRFVRYYEELGFQLLSPAPMLHPTIPMSFVMSAGLVQIETSLAKAQNRTGSKFVLVQKCFRHFDLDTVGTDDIHLSLFEMPGAFVFGKDSKQNAIENMWQLATKILGIDESRIWASHFSGGSIGDLQLLPDECTRQTWINIGLPGSRIVGLGIDHNYWVQGNGGQTNGENGSSRRCGVNTELFYDRGTELSCSTKCQPGCKCGRFVEFSNSLLISHKLHLPTNILTPLDDPFSETVIGTERVAMILQDVKSIFDTENYRPIVNIVRQFSTYKNLPNDLVLVSERKIADHMRALCVLVANGAPPPGKNGRERIVKLLIRDVLTRQIILGILSKEFLPILIKSVTEILDNSISFTLQTQKEIKEYFEIESLRFKKTIERGHRIMEHLLEKNHGETLSGSQILFLEKKYGLPHALTARMLHEKRLSFAEIEYKERLKSWKNFI